MPDKEKLTVKDLAELPFKELTEELWRRTKRADMLIGRDRRPPRGAQHVMEKEEKPKEKPKRKRVSIIGTSVESLNKRRRAIGLDPVREEDRGSIAELLASLTGRKRQRGRAQHVLEEEAP